MTTAQTPPAKTNTTALLVIGISIGALFCICCAAIALSLNSGSSSGSPFSTDIQVKYVVAGSATGASVTYNNEQGGTEQIDARLPWTKEMKVSPGTALSIVAQNNGSGSVTCEIWENGKKVKTSTSTAQYGVVTCTDFPF